MDQAQQAAKMTTIFHLLNRTVENGATVAEAASAAAKAQELAFKYNLDLAAAQAQGAPKGPGIVGKPFDLRSNHTWKRELFAGICHCNFGKGLVWAKTRRAEVFAEEQNQKIIEYLYTYLEKAIMKLANEAWHNETQGRKYTRSAQGEGENTFKDRFGRGCATAIISRLYVQREKDKTASSESSALVVVKTRELEEAMNTAHPKTKTTQGLKRSSTSAWSQGVVAGRTVALNAALVSGR